jgi:hypothetical protein
LYRLNITIEAGQGLAGGQPGGGHDRAENQRCERESRYAPRPNGNEPAYLADPPLLDYYKRHQ